MINLKDRLFGIKSDSNVENPLECARAIGLLTVCLKADMPVTQSIIISWRNSKGAIRKLFEKSIRKSSMGSANSLEEAIENDAEDLPEKIDWASQSMIDFLRAAEEEDSDQRQRMLEKAHENALESCRQSIREAISGLRVPFSTIFAMGIVLPIVVATILPLWGMVSIQDIQWDFNDRSTHLGNSQFEGASDAIILAGCLILMFPIFCILSAKHFVKNRDLISSDSLEDLANRLLLVFLGLGAFSLIYLSIFNWSGNFWIFISMLSFLSLFANGLTSTRNEKDSTVDFIQSPSILNSICSRLSQGEHFARALLFSNIDPAVSRRMFWQSMLYPLEPKNEDIRSDGGLELMEMASDKEPRIAATVFRQLSAHLSDLEKIQKEMRNELRPIAQSALVATVMLCPFVLGMIAGFNSIGLLSMDGNMTFSIFEVIFAIFIIEMGLTGSWLMACLLPDGKGIPKLLVKPRNMSLLAIAVFLISLQVSTAIFA